MFSNQQQRPMRTIYHSLLWKEWHEHKWKLAMLVLVTVLLSLLFWRGEPQMLPVAVTTLLFGYSVLAGLFLGMQTAAGERGRGTMPFLQTLPVSVRKPAAIKVLMAWVTAFVPVLLVVGLAYAYLSSYNSDSATLTAMADSSVPQVVLDTWGRQNWLLGTGLSGILCVTSLLIWMAAAGVNRSDEIRAGAIGFLIMASVWVFIGILGYWAEEWKSSSLDHTVRVMMSAAAGGPSIGGGNRGPRESYLPFVAAAVLSHGCVMAWFLVSFGRHAVRPARTRGGRGKIGRIDWLGPPRKSQLTAIIWKQVSETGPLAVVAAAAILAMTSLAFWFDSGSQSRGSYAELLAGIALSVGFLVTVVAGMGVFLEDVKPKIGIFRRSRPVNVTMWFVVKYCTGLMVLAITFGALFLLAFLMPNGQRLLSSEYAGEQVAAIALVFLLVYTLSMACYCLGRQPIFAAVTAISVFFLGVYTVDFLIFRSLPADMRLFGALAVMVVAQVALTALAWLAVRNNWGWNIE